MDEIILIVINKQPKEKYEQGNEEYSTNITPMDHRNEISKIYSYKIIGSNEGTVWGGKNKIYTDDSNIAKAAVFEGLIKLGEKAIVNIKIIEKKNLYIYYKRIHFDFRYSSIPINKKCFWIYLIIKINKNS